MEPATAPTSQTVFDSDDRSLRQLASVLFARIGLVLSIFLGVFGISVYAFFFFLSPTYEVSATIIIDPSDALLPMVETAPPSDLDKLTTFHTQKDILTSSTIATRVVDRMKLDKTRVLSRWEKLKLKILGYRKRVGQALGIASWTKDQDLRAICIDTVVDALQTEARLDSRAIKISYSARDPEEAANTLNTLIEEYREFF